MANAKRCDRCGRFYDFYEGIEFIAGANRYVNLVLEGTNGHNRREFDLCPDCMQKLVDFLKNEEKEGE